MQLATPGSADFAELSEVTLHGHRVCFRHAGEGEPIVLIHGITGSSEQWLGAMETLTDQFTVVAPDLLGHGESAKPRGDYSLGAYATGIRDLLVGLELPPATIVGHSLGGGIAMQFAYQFPERCSRLVLVSSGGLGAEVNPLLRAASLPGSELVLPLLTHARLLGAGTAVGRGLGRLGLQAGTDLAEIARGYASLGDPETRAAFIHTLRSVIDPWGQRVDATDRLYLASRMASLIVWGERDKIIPCEHGRSAHEAMPGSRFELLEGVGHFPHLERATQFARLLRQFIESTEPALLTADDLRDLALA
jgi:pimeloyl-ACP methyl ester carboxylesterase